jgi:hypothetical protein
VLLLAAFLVRTSLPAQTRGENTSLVNQWLRDESTAFNSWDLGGQLRVRFEDKENFATPGRGTVDFQRDGGNGDNAYFLFREKFHLGYKSDWITVFGELRDSRTANDERKPHPETDPLDLQQAYVLIGDSGKIPFTLKLGRQELSYGDERLVGASDWSNLGRVFDAAKLRYENQNFWIDTFVSRVVLPNPSDFDEANDYDFLSGIYASSKTVVPGNEAQIYLLARNVSVKSPNAIGAGLPAFMTGASARDIYTAGFRVKSLPNEFGGWDYDAELAAQLGNVKSSTGARLDHEAFAAHVAGGYTWTNFFGKPRAGLEYNFATGDSNPNDGKHGTFDNLLPTNHKFYGYMDFVSWQNIHDGRVTASLKPLKKLTLTSDCHAFWLADKNDFFYQVNGAPRGTGGYGIHAKAGSYVGSEIDLNATYNVCEAVTVQGGYGHFFRGDYVKNSLSTTSGAVDANWFYLQMSLNF